MFHKRIADNRLLGNRTHQLCKPQIAFSGEAYSYGNPEFVLWVKTTAYHWERVTCPDCLRLRIFKPGQRHDRDIRHAREIENLQNQIEILVRENRALTEKLRRKELDHYG